MSNQLTVPAGFGGVTNRFANSAAAKEALNELGGGISSSFAIVSIKGKVFRVKYQGDERKIMRPDEPDTVASYVDVVLVKSSPAISKLFYIDGFVDGSNNPPDCFSTNGMVPDPASPKKQCETCAACPQNAWGSKITPNGKKGKTCADSKRVSVSPIADLKNESFGGPMLMRVPAASLRDAKEYGEFCANQLGFPTYAVVTRISFDADEAYPKLVFKPVRPLSDAELDVVEELRAGAAVARMLDEPVDEVKHEPAVAAPVAGFIEPQPAPAAAPAPVATAAAPAPVAVPVAVKETKAPIAVQEAPTAMDDAIDGVMPASVTKDLDAELAALLLRS